MDIYIVGIFIGILIYLFVGFVVGKQVKNLEDYYVSGRNATSVFIAGTMFASMLSTNGFMGDTAYAYSGNITTLFLINTICACGYVIGALFFGRYIRRAKANTMPSYFLQRFNSKRLGRFAGIITIISLSAYLLSVIQGVGILMQSLTNLPKFSSLFIAWLCILLFTLKSGSKGVVIIDTAMCICFLLSTILIGSYVFDKTGGLSNLILNLATDPNTPKDLLTYHGNTGNGSVFDIVTYGFTIGIIWMITVSVSPWQAGRNLMAKSEHTIFRAGVMSSLLTIFFLLYLYIIAISVIKIYPNMPDPERVIIYVAYELTPSFLGAFLLTGILSAGLSSATTFLSVVSFSLANDIFDIKFKSEKEQVVFTRKAVFIVSVIALFVAYFELASIRIIAWFASTIIAASWGFVAFGSVWCKWLSERGAYYSMVGGFFSYLVSKALTEFGIFELKNIFNPFFIAVFISIVCAYFGSKGEIKSQKEIDFYEKLHILPKTELMGREYKIDKIYAYILIIAGVFTTWFLIKFWALPYNEIVRNL